MTAIIQCGGMFECPPQFGTDEIGRAAAICHQHAMLSQFIPPPRIPQFRKGWEACSKVYAVWLDGEAARKIREQEAEQERQRLFVNELAERLK